VRQVEAVALAFEAQTVTLDQLLEAQRRRADAQAAFFRTLLDYQRAIIGVHYRKGSLLEYNNVYLTEGPWPAKAKFDAHRLARQRDAALYINYGFTRPAVSSQGPINQGTDGHGPALNSKQGTAPQTGVPTEAATPEDATSPEDNELPAPKSFEEQPAPGADELPEPTVSQPGSQPITQYNGAPARLPAPPASAGGNTTAGSGSGNAARSGFDWGSLGLDGKSITADKGGQITGGLSEAKRPAPAKALPTADARPSSRLKASTAAAMNMGKDAAVQGAKHQEWKSAPQHEPVQNQSPGPALGSASGWQGQ
jgi:hypothetical protein